MSRDWQDWAWFITGLCLGWALGSATVLITLLVKGGVL